MAEVDARIPLMGTMTNPDALVQQQQMRASQQEQQRAQQMQPYKIQGAQQEISAAKTKEASDKLDKMLQILGGVQSPADIPMAKQMAAGLGADLSQFNGMPDEQLFDMIPSLQQMTLSEKDKLGKYTAMNVTGTDAAGNPTLQAMVLNTRTGVMGAPQGLPAGASIQGKYGEKLPASGIQLFNKLQELKAAGNTQGINELYTFAKTQERYQTRAPDGTLIMAPGAVDTIFQAAAAGEGGKQQQQLKYTAPKAAAEMAGKGEITPIQQKIIAQKQVTGTLTNLSDMYGELIRQGAAISPSQTSSQNLKSRFSVSSLGQALGGAMGTKTQETLDKIATQQPLLINAIRQASAMGAKGMDSEKELAFYLKAATDPSRIVEANLAALATLDAAYGLGGGIVASPEEKSRLQFEFKKSLAGSSAAVPTTLGIGESVPPGIQQPMPGWSVEEIK